MRRRIATALDQLPRRQREAFILVHLEGFTVHECADFLGKRSGTVKSHLHRALVSLRTKLEDLKDLTPSAQRYRLQIHKTTSDNIRLELTSKNFFSIVRYIIRRTRSTQRNRQPYDGSDATTELRELFHLLHKAVAAIKKDTEGEFFH